MKKKLFNKQNTNIIFLPLLLLTASYSKADQYAFLGVPERFSFQLKNQNATQKCGVSVTTPSGEVIDQEAFAPNFIVNAAFTPTSDSKATFKWTGKILFKGILPTPPCNGSGDFSVDIISSTPQLNNDDLERFEQARSKLNSKLSKDALDIALPIAIRGSKSAQSMAAFIFFNGGPGVSRDLARAYNFAKISSSERSSKLILGIINLNGLGRPQSCQEGVNYLNEVVELDLSAAYGILGDAHLNGRCVARNYPEALRLYQRGVEKRNGTSAAGIGSIYENGFGVAINLEEAKIWYQRAREFGHLRADDMIQRIDRKIATGEETRKKSEEEARLASRRKEISDENDRKRMEIERLQGELRKMQPGPSK